MFRSNKIESTPEVEELSGGNGQIAARLVRVVFSGGRKLVRDPAESILILRMASWVAILSLLVKLQPLPRALKLVSVGVLPTSKDAPAETEKRLSHAIDLLLGTNLLVFKPICWKRAAVLHRYLALHGIATRIVFGMRKTPEGAVDGHAWLEIGGKPILEATIPNYKVMYAFPSQETCNLDLSSLTSPVRH
ncbi:MAG TPA: lasso peptide biosynthesis B2 protein [Pyrinomonadaceae bacterium]|nr:lasso peptide biosynthesis B2 protein [Pyrinomonadaceae bacterium]